jgi:hypothetical protein
MAAISPTRIHDEVFPKEILRIVFSNQFSVADLKVCDLVCKKWKETTNLAWCSKWVKIATKREYQIGKYQDNVNYKSLFINSTSSDWYLKCCRIINSQYVEKYYINKCDSEIDYVKIYNVIKTKQFKFESAALNFFTGYETIHTAKRPLPLKIFIECVSTLFSPITLPLAGTIDAIAAIEHTQSEEKICDCFSCKAIRESAIKLMAREVIKQVDSYYTT